MSHNITLRNKICSLFSGTIALQWVLLNYTIIIIIAKLHKRLRNIIDKQRENNVCISAGSRINSNTHFSFNSLFLCLIISRDHFLTKRIFSEHLNPQAWMVTHSFFASYDALDLSSWLYRLISHHYGYSKITPINNSHKWLFKIPLFILFYNTRFSYSCPKPRMWSCTLSPPPNLQFSSFHAFLANETQSLAKIPNHVQNSNCRSKDV